VAAVLAVLAAMLFALGSVLQQRAASSVSTERAQGAGLIALLLTRPLWLAGTAAEVGGFVSEVAAVGVGSLVLVQALLATTLLFALPAGAWLAGRRLRRSDWAWAVVLAGGLAIFLVVGSPTTGNDTAPLRRWVVAAAILVPMIALSVINCLSRRGRGRAVCFALAAGALFGAVASLIKPCIHFAESGAGDLVTTWEPYALLACAALGFTLQQSAYQSGGLAATLPAICVVEPCTAAGLGVGVLEETLRVESVGGWVLIAAALAAMISGLIALARAEAAVHGSPPPAGSAELGLPPA
jgi:drug/metabolite transporter (DMT)-like permease